MQQRSARCWHLYKLRVKAVSRPDESMYIYEIKADRLGCGVVMMVGIKNRRNKKKMQKRNRQERGKKRQKWTGAARTSRTKVDKNSADS